MIDIWNYALALGKDLNAMVEPVTLQSIVSLVGLWIMAKLIYTWWKHKYWANLPPYNKIPASSLNHIASKKVLSDLSGNVDIAIVGSGIGALSSASILARCGYKVVVFEQHYTIGGSTHMYTDGGFEFDVGVHYVGGKLDCWTSPFKHMYNTLTDGKLEWSRLADVYDVAYNASTGERLELTGDPRMNRKCILTHFPHLDKKSLDKYYQKCFRARQVAFIAFFLKILPPIFTRLVWPFFNPVYRRMCTRKTMAVMQECGLPQDVIGALTYCWGDYGTTPAESPFFVQAFMESHYDGGGFFPKGGSSSIAKTMVAAINRRGGEVFAASPVEQIITKKTFFGNYRAVGVRVRGVDIMVRKSVISDAGFTKTFGVAEHPNSDHADLIEEDPLLHHEASAKQLNLIRTKDNSSPFRPSFAFFYLFVGLDGTDKDLHLPGQNIWHVKDWNHDAFVNELCAKSSVDEALKEEPPLVFLSNESAKDPDYNERHPGKCSVTIIAMAKAEWFHAWSETSHGHRGKEYDKIKTTMTNTLLEILYKHFPKTKGKVSFTEIGTPLSTNKYLGRKSGEIYNLDHNASRFDSLGAQLALHPQTTVNDLFLVGQDVFAVSIEGATMSGFFTAGRVSYVALILFCIPAAVGCFQYCMFS